jgi:hypothetical protein
MDGSNAALHVNTTESYAMYILNSMYTHTYYAITLIKLKIVKIVIQNMYLHVYNYINNNYKYIVQNKEFMIVIIILT